MLSLTDPKAISSTPDLLLVDKTDLSSLRDNQESSRLTSELHTAHPSLSPGPRAPKTVQGDSTYRQDPQEGHLSYPSEKKNMPTRATVKPTGPLVTPERSGRLKHSVLTLRLSPDRCERAQLLAEACWPSPTSRSRPRSPCPVCQLPRPCFRLLLLLYQIHQGGGAQIHPFSAYKMFPNGP